LATTVASAAGPTTGTWTLSKEPLTEIGTGRCVAFQERAPFDVDHSVCPSVSQPWSASAKASLRFASGIRVTDLTVGIATQWAPPSAVR
jgi:hypothetical protein